MGIKKSKGNILIGRHFRRSSMNGSVFSKARYTITPPPHEDRGWGLRFGRYAAGFCLPLVAGQVIGGPDPVASKGQGHSLIKIRDENRNGHS